MECVCGWYKSWQNCSRWNREILQSFCHELQYIWFLGRPEGTQILLCRWFGKLWWEGKVKEMGHRECRAWEYVSPNLSRYRGHFARTQPSSSSKINQFIFWGAPLHLRDNILHRTMVKVMGQCRACFRLHRSWRDLITCHAHPQGPLKRWRDWSHFGGTKTWSYWYSSCFFSPRWQLQ